MIPMISGTPLEVWLSEQHPKKKVLVVDDDDAIRMMVERVLKREHYEVESARDGFEAIEKLSGNDYATVLLDLMMPRVDGHGVIRFLEQNTAVSLPSRRITPRCAHRRSWISRPGSRSRRHRK